MSNDRTGSGKSNEVEPLGENQRLIQTCLRAPRAETCGGGGSSQVVESESYLLRSRASPREDEPSALVSAVEEFVCELWT
jgi:hypothetical protein